MNGTKTSRRLVEISRTSLLSRPNLDLISPSRRLQLRSMLCLPMPVTKRTCLVVYKTNIRHNGHRTQKKLREPTSYIGNKPYLLYHQAAHSSMHKI
jgi:hypothetical protein